MPAPSQPPTANSQAPRRLQDWPTRLYALVESRASTPFAWGSHDCCLFACDGIRALTGLDPAETAYRGKYHNAAGAARLLARAGGVEAIAATTCAAHGWPELATPRLAQRGDLVLIDLDRQGRPATPSLRAALGICLGPTAAFAAPTGLAHYPLAACRRAWRIG